jgi:hypothetical protein
MRWIPECLANVNSPANNPLQATRWSGHLVFERQAQRAPERER